MFRITLLFFKAICIASSNVRSQMFPDLCFRSENGRFAFGHVGQPVGVDVGIFDLGGHPLQ